jgi:hypothetical protein
VRLTADTGYFWFFSSTNVELVVKVLDGRAITGHFWVFYGALSNVRYTMIVRDLQTGDVRTYENPSGQFASVGDTSAFPPDTLPAAARRVSSVRAPGALVPNYSALRRMEPNEAAACVPGATALCLGGGRFRVAAAWKDFAGNTGVGQAVALTTDTGYFWFFSSSNVEVVIKALDGRVLNDHYWVFYGALSNVEYTMTVTDTVTGIVRTYENPSGLFASVGDVAAFGKPTTFELIDGAVVKGEITDETALLYKVYAYFGDARLPTAYVGDPPSGDREHGILTDVIARWSTLSAATRQALDPFLLPPIYPESPFARGAASRSPQQAGSILADWSRMDTLRASVWYRAADAGAATAASNLFAEIENVWTTEESLMGRGPKSDGGLDHNGGDDKLDIYVLPSFRTPDPTDKPDGMVVPYKDTLDLLPGDPPNIERGAYILIRSSAASTHEGARDVLAHEFFHAIALNQKNTDGVVASRWLNEATATWMEDYVYPTQIRNFEHAAGGRYFTDGYRVKFDEPPDGGYADYLFFFYLARKFSPNLNRDIWNNLVGNSSLQAIDAAIPGGFKERWPEFAMYCWDHPGVDKFAQWDSISSGLVDGSAEPYLAFSSGNGDGTSLPGGVVPHLAMRYAFIEVLSDDVKRLEIQTPPVAGGAANAKTSAWIKLADGTTRVEDWTSKTRVVFCRDKATENVTGLMLLRTNSSRTLPAVWGDGKVIADTVGCGGFRGTVHSIQRLSKNGVTANQIMDATARFLPHPLLTDYYYLAELTLRYSSSAYDSNTGCSLIVEPVTERLTLRYGDDGISQIVIDKTTQPPGYSAAGNDGFMVTARAQCNGQSGGDIQTGGGGEWWRAPEGLFHVNSDGTLSGSHTFTDPDGNAQWTWSFAPD